MALKMKYNKLELNNHYDKIQLFSNMYIYKLTYLFINLRYI